MTSEGDGGATETVAREEERGSRHAAAARSALNDLTAGDTFSSDKEWH